METRSGVFAPASGLPEAARIVFVGAFVMFTLTIVIGILNGLDVWEPEHDTLLTHVHSGTLGWITLGVAGLSFLAFSRDREVSAAEVERANKLAWGMVGAIALYVLAFLAGDSIFDDRIQRPVFGTLLFIVVIWFLTWVWGANKSYGTPSPARTGLVLAWISMLIGAVFGIILGLYVANDEVPGLSDDVAGRVADAHPPAMLIGYLLLAAFSAVQWLLHSDKPTRLGTIQVWLLFVAGIVINIAFVTGTDEELAGPANLLMIVAVFILLWQSRSELTSSWKDNVVTVFPRLATLALVVGLGLLTLLIIWVIQDEIDFEALTPSQEGVGLGFDHTMFIAVMSNVLFGTLAANLVTPRLNMANRVLIWGVNIGIAGFVIGLVTTTQVMKQIFTPLMGVSLLFGLAAYFMEMRPKRA